MIFNFVTGKHNRALLIIVPFLIAAGFSFSTCNQSNSTPSALPDMPPVGEDFFMDVSEYSGIEFTQTFGDDLLSNVVETVG
ncbi:MAG: hypothetical protein U5K72_01155 [Balneolaceae bacterium]|nr:hypothetical protein [Balneolaceae bacterium]